MREVNILHRYLTGIVGPAMGAPVSGEGVCDRCGQRVAAGYAVKSSYKIVGRDHINFNCQACRSLDVGSAAITGIERSVGAKQVANKFGMMASAGTVIETETGKTIFFAPQKIMDKFPDIFLRNIDVRPVLGLAQLQMIDDECAPPFLYISDFGRKTDTLIKNLKITVGLDAVFACNDTNVTEIPYAAAKAVHAGLKTVDNPDFALFVQTVSRLAKGEITPIDAYRAIENDDLLSAFRLLPADPHLRLTLLSVLKSLRLADKISVNA